MHRDVLSVVSSLSRFGPLERIPPGAQPQRKVRAMDIPDRDQIQGVPAAAVYRWVFLVAVNLCVPYQVLMGLLDLTGFHRADWRMEPRSFLGALFLGPLYGFLAAVLITACLGSAFLVMRWVFAQWDEES